MILESIKYYNMTLILNEIYSSNRDTVGGVTALLFTTSLLIKVVISNITRLQKSI